MDAVILAVALITIFTLFTVTLHKLSAIEAILRRGLVVNNKPREYGDEVVSPIAKDNPGKEKDHGGVYLMTDKRDQDILARADEG